MPAARARRFGQLVAAIVLIAGCNMLAGIDERETKQVDGSGGERAAQGGDSTVSNSAGEGGVGGTAGEVGTAQGGSTQGGTTASGGISGAGDGGVDGGGAGETAHGGTGGTAHGGTNASGGSQGSGGRVASGGAGAGGSTSTGPCLGLPNEWMTTGWTIYAGPHGGGTISPAGDNIKFQDGGCVCFSGTVVNGEWSAQFYFQHEAIPLTSLDLKLIMKTDSAVPTLYVHSTTDDNMHCVLLPNADLIAGTQLHIPINEFHSADCRGTDRDLDPGSLIDQITFQYDTYDVSNQSNFDICVIALAVH